MRILVTGAAGFIGSALIRNLVALDCARRSHVPLRITAVDSLQRNGNWDALEGFARDDRVELAKVDILDKQTFMGLPHGHQIVIHCAALTSVDESFANRDEFVRTNVDGSRNVAQASKESGVPIFVHFSTDEVYGACLRGVTAETANLEPTNPYSESKVYSEHVVERVFEGTDTRLVVVRPSNNYGPWQYPDNLIPKFAKLLARGEKIPLYGSGEHRRSWIHVDDTFRAVFHLLQSPAAHGVYNIGGEELSNRKVTQTILDFFNKDWNVVESVAGRPINDLRYCNDESKLQALGYSRSRRFSDEIASVLQHYAERFRPC